MNEFRRPQKVILTPAHLAQFQDSETCKKVVDFIGTLNDAVTGLKITEECTESEVNIVTNLQSQPTLTNTSLMKGVMVILSILDQVEGIAKNTPPANNVASRFGNPAFKEFYDKLSAVCLRTLAFQSS